MAIPTIFVSLDTYYASKMSASRCALTALRLAALATMVTATGSAASTPTPVSVTVLSGGAPGAALAWLAPDPSINLAGYVITAVPGQEEGEWRRSGYMAPAACGRSRAVSVRTPRRQDAPAWCTGAPTLRRHEPPPRCRAQPRQSAMCTLPGAPRAATCAAMVHRGGASRETPTASILRAVAGRTQRAAVIRCRLNLYTAAVCS
jgi:hypothetical protein